MSRLFQQNKSLSGRIDFFILKNPETYGWFKHKVVSSKITLHQIMKIQLNLSTNVLFFFIYFFGKKNNIYTYSFRYFNRITNDIFSIYKTSFSNLYLVTVRVKLCKTYIAKIVSTAWWYRQRLAVLVFDVPARILMAQIEYHQFIVKMDCNLQ